MPTKKKEEFFPFFSVKNEPGGVLFGILRPAVVCEYANKNAHSLIVIGWDFPSPQFCVGVHYNQEGWL